MRLARFARTAALGGAAFALALVVGSPALATPAPTRSPDAHPILLPGQQGKTAGDFDASCDQIPNGSVPAGKEGWVFNLPGNHTTTGDFTSLTLAFNTPGGPVTINIMGDHATYPMGIITTSGTSKAYVILPAGWTLTNGSADITGVADYFVVTHTCRTTSTTSPSPSSSESKSKSPTPGGGGSSSSGGGGGGLPITGAPLTGIIVSGLVLIVGGVTLFVMRRRRDTTTFMVE